MRSSSVPTPRARLRLNMSPANRSASTQIVLSTQHVDEDLTSERRARIVEPYIVKTLPQGWVSDETVWHVNPTGKFVIGGPDGDTGLTGRKIIVDTYGGAAPHGGGAFSGKDPTKVDRSAAYAARYLAKNVVAAGLADRVTIQLSYAIGVAEPLSIYVDTHGTGKVQRKARERAVRDHAAVAARHPRTPEPQSSDLCAHLGLWPFRSQAGSGRRLLLGKHRSGREDQGAFRLIARRPPLAPHEPANLRANRGPPAATRACSAGARESASPPATTHCCSPPSGVAVDFRPGRAAGLFPCP